MKKLFTLLFVLFSGLAFSTGHTVNISVTQTVTCFGGTDGAAQVTVGGGVGPFTYTWTPSGGNAAIATGLNGSTTYTCSVTDLNDMSVSTNTVVIAQPTNPNIIISGPSLVCSGSMVTLFANGVGLTNYIWMGPNGFTANGQSAFIPNVTMINSGTYTVTATGTNGCNYSSTHLLMVDNLNAAVSPINATCFGLCNGSVVGTAFGGSTPYTYSWSPGGNTTLNLNGVCAGSYTLSVTDANGCVLAVSTVVTQPSPVAAAITNVVNATCGQCDGSMQVVATGGTPGYTYLWNTSNTTSPINNLCAGNYSVAVTDANGCVANANATVNSGAINFTVATTPDNCGQNSGTATVGGLTGTVGNVTYSWLPGSMNTQQVAGLGAGTYTVSATDSLTCSTSQTFTITGANVPFVVATGNGTACGTNNGLVVANAGGGAGGPYMYSLNGGPYTLNQTYTGLAPGIYTITVQDVNGCMASATWNVLSFGLSANIVTTPASCNGIANGSAVAIANSSNLPISYLWNNGSTNDTITNIAQGVYSCTITDGIGCTATVTGQVGQNNGMYICAYTSYYNCGTGIANVIVNGGALPYSYLWQPGGLTTPTITTTSPTVYTVTVTDANGCSATGYNYVINQSYNIVTGTIYADVNNNCTNDAGDYNLINGNIIANDGTNNYYGYINNNGDYSVYLPNVAQSYTLTFTGGYNYNSSYYTNTCGNNVVSLTSNCDTAIVNIGLSITPAQDLKITSYCGVARPGFTRFTSYTYQNVGTVAVAAAQVKVQIDPLLSYVGATPVPSSVVGNLVTWNVGTLQPQQSGVIQLSTLVPTIGNGGAIGTLINDLVSIEPLIGDVAAANNSANCTTQITAAYDPNFKEVFQGNMAQAATIGTGITDLYYTVHFQNTGNDTAFTVVIKDTISNLLDLSTLEVLSASHAYTEQILPNRTLQITFPSILLPDSFVNEPLSHGYVHYRIKTIAGLTAGQIINNTGNIYFDFNPAIVTNTTNSQVVIIGINEANNYYQAQVYPNPLSNNQSLMVKLNGVSYQGLNFTLYDNLGRIAFSKKLAEQPNHEINLGELNQGIYHYQIMNGNGQGTSGKLMIGK